jgi:hypothetical protein
MKPKTKQNKTKDKAVVLTPGEEKHKHRELFKSRVRL